MAQFVASDPQRDDQLPDKRMLFKQRLVDLLTERFRVGRNILPPSLIIP